MQSLSQNSTQIENLSAQLNSLLEGQSRLLRERAELYKKRIAVSIFENKLMSVLNIKMIDVPQLIERCTKISAAEKEAQL